VTPTTEFSVFWQHSVWDVHTADLLGFLNNGAGTITATNGTVYQTSAYFGNPNIASGSRDATEPFAYVSFVISGATIDTLWFYNTSATGSSFESDNHSVISSAVR